MGMDNGKMGPTMVGAIPLKMNPKKSTARKPVRLLLVSSGIAALMALSARLTSVVVDMGSSILKEALAGGNFELNARQVTSRTQIRVRSSANFEGSWLQ